MSALQPRSIRQPNVYSAKVVLGYANKFPEGGFGLRIRSTYWAVAALTLAACLSGSSEDISQGCDDVGGLRRAWIDRPEGV